MQLKRYQQRSLDALRAYFAEVRRLESERTQLMELLGPGQFNPARMAFETVTNREIGLQSDFKHATELPGLPYVCLRLPTGGGKTLLAAHAAGLAARELVETDMPVVLWLVPSNPIREQTLAALRGRTHPYRQAAEERLGPVEVMDVEEALAASRAKYAGNAVIIVATMQAFRVSDTDGRKVYEQNGSLMDHFTGLPGEAIEDLERLEDGSAVSSFANVLRLYRPIVIVDEAHNARTDLSFETLARFRPSCVIEFSATPAFDGHPSNVLHSVSAAELDVEDMIKLPIRLVTRPDWQLLLADAIAQLNALGEAASRERVATGEYIRPIMLIQAEARHGADPITVEVVRTTLLDDHRTPPDQIAIATGGTSDLENLEVLSPACPVRFVITVQQLREGWDCPFAYVLCSLAQTRSSTAVEQILGRVMRLPRASKKTQEELNRAYAFSASASFAEAATALTDALVHNGFERHEAQRIITSASPIEGTGDLPLFDGWSSDIGAESITISIPAVPDFSGLPKDLADRITIDVKARTLTLRGGLTRIERDELADTFPGEIGNVASAELHRLADRATGKIHESIKSEAANRFQVPYLSIRQGDIWEPFDATHFLEAEWDLSKCDPQLSSDEWVPSSGAGRSGEITITDRGKAEYFIGELDHQLGLVADDPNWSVGALVHWLDRGIDHPDVGAEASGIFLTNLVRHLMEERGIPLAALVRGKYGLRKAVAAKIQEHRNTAYGSEYQALLLPDSPTPVGVSPEVCFSYEPGKYPYKSIYRGARTWTKHHYPVVGDLKSDGEEFDCACFLDEDLSQVERWVRNVERLPSFWLQTSTDRFYPDFVCKLRDGRILVVEYKGEHLWSNDDSKHKRDLGDLWENRSNGKCLFIMPKGKDFGAIRAKVEASHGRNGETGHK